MNLEMSISVFVNVSHFFLIFDIMNFFFFKNEKKLK